MQMRYDNSVTPPPQEVRYRSPDMRVQFTVPMTGLSTMRGSNPQTQIPKQQIDALNQRVTQYESYIKLLESQNKNLQYELQEVAVHLNSYKDRFEQFQRMDIVNNQQTNDYLVQQIERLTEMLKQKNTENQELQKHLNSIKQNYEQKIQQFETQLEQYRIMVSAHESGQQFVQTLQNKIQKLTQDYQDSQKTCQLAQQQEEFWRKLYEEERTKNVLVDSVPKSSSSNNTPLINTTQSAEAPAPNQERRTTKAKLQWKLSTNV